MLNRNGVGKTTLMRPIAGQVPIRSGQLTFTGHDIARLSSADRARRGFACLPRGEHQVPEEVFELMPILATMRKQRGGDLSGGQGSSFGRR